MKRTHDNTRIAEFFVKAGLVAAIAAVLLAPGTVRAADDQPLGVERHSWTMLKRVSWDDLPLPPIPYLETMPWIKWDWLNRQRPGPAEPPVKIDTLLAPEFKFMRPAVVESTGGTRLSSIVDLAGNG